MLSYLLSRKSKFKILPPTVLARNLWQLPPITSNPPFWHTHTQNSKLTPVSIGSPVWLEYFPGFFSRGGLPKVRRCKIPFGKIRHMICGGNEKRRLLYNYRYQCIILQGISLSLFLPVYCFGFLLVNDLRVVLCALKFRLRNFTNPNCSTTRTSSRGVAIKQMAHRRDSLSLHILREKIRKKRTFNEPCQVSVEKFQSFIY